MTDYRTESNAYYGGDSMYAPRPRKPWYKKWWAIACFVFLGVGVVANLGNRGDDAVDPSVTVVATTAKAAPKQPAPLTQAPAKKPSQAAPTLAEEVPAPPQAPATPVKKAEPVPVEPAPVEAEPVQAEPDVPAEHSAALDKAQSYVDLMHFSKAKLYDQLTSEHGEQFPKAAAKYAVAHVQADWNEEALEAAKSYREMMSMSNSGIHDQLTSQYGEQFSKAQADYAIAHIDD